MIETGASTYGLKAVKSFILYFVIKNWQNKNENWCVCIMRFIPNIIDESRNGEVQIQRGTMVPLVIA